MKSKKRKTERIGKNKERKKEQLLNEVVINSFEESIQRKNEKVNQKV